MIIIYRIFTKINLLKIYNMSSRSEIKQAIVDRFKECLDEYYEEKQSEATLVFTVQREPSGKVTIVTYIEDKPNQVSDFNFHNN